MLSNRITLFDGFNGSGYAEAPAIWSLSLKDNSNGTIRLVAGLNINGSGGQYVTAILSPGETSTNATCLNALGSSIYSTNIVWFTDAGLVNLTPAVEVVRATEVNYSHQLTLVSGSLVANVTQYTSGSNVTFSGLTLALKNTETKPIVLIQVVLNGNGFQYIVAFPCTVSGIFGFTAPGPVPTPENPLMPGQTATIETPLFSPPVTARQTYQFTVVAGFSDGTEVTFSAAIQAK